MISFKGSGARRPTGKTTQALAWIGWFTWTGFAHAEIIKSDLVIGLERVADGLVSPVHATHANDGSGRLFIVDQAGQIRIVKNGVLLPTPFLDVSAQLPALNTTFDERGLLGLAFHPNYRSNGRFFIRYSRPRTSGPLAPCNGTSRGCHEEVLAEHRVSADDPDVADPNGTILFRIDEPEFNHNAGMVAFGPDGYLYFSLGDGGGANDDLDRDNLPHTRLGHGQNIETPLGAVLRIDVDRTSPYAIPPDNPFVGRAGVDEVYAYGFRNPYRFSFDGRPGGDGRLWVADVGQNLVEEIDIVERGGNYGWALKEGSLCFDPFNPLDPPETCDSTGLIDPIAEYLHEEGGLSIIGGYVYRGTLNPELEGQYVFGDFSGAFFQPTGRLYFLHEHQPGTFQIMEFRLTGRDLPYGRFLKGFGEDENGELYVLGTTALGPTGNSGVVERLRVLRCRGTEQIARAKCKTGDAGRQLVVKLTGGNPAENVLVTLSTGQDKLTTLNANGAGKVKFNNLEAGAGSASAVWDCGSVAGSDYTCP